MPTNTAIPRTFSVTVNIPLTLEDAALVALVLRTEATTVGLASPELASHLRRLARAFRTDVAVSC